MATRMMKLFDPGEMEEYIKRGAARRKDIAGYQMELQRAVDTAQMARRERAEVGATRRERIKEAGLGERLGRTQAFARPREMALTKKTLGEAAAGTYALGLEKELKPTVKGIMEQKKTLGGLDIQAMEQELEAGKPPVAATPTVPAVAAKRAVAKPTVSKRKRELRPSITEMLHGLARPFRDVYGGLASIYEYAYPKVR